MIRDTAVRNGTVYLVHCLESRVTTLESTMPPYPNAVAGTGIELCNGIFGSPLHVVVGLVRYLLPSTEITNNNNNNTNHLNVRGRTIPGNWHPTKSVWDKHPYREKHFPTTIATTNDVIGRSHLYYPTITHLIMMSFQPLATTGAPSGNATGPTLSPTGWMALLQENDLTVQDLALQKLLEQVHEAWHEIAECLPELEAMADDRELPPALQHRAAAVASRVLFHLQEPQQALRLALQAGMEYFDPMDHRNPYVERLVQAALDAYTQQLRQERSEGMPDASATVPHAIAADEGTPAVPTQALQTMVYTLMESSCRQGNYIPALGIAIEAHEAERFRVILEAGIATDPTLLKYALQMVLSTITSKSFRMQALQVLSIQLQTQFKHHKQAAYDLIVVYQLLQQPEPVAEVLQQLLQGTDPDDSLLALQLCFDLMDTGNQAFCQQVAQQIHHEQALRILTGGFVGELALSFLYKHNQTDRAIMDNLKKALDERSSRSSLLHNAAVLTHSYLYAGTTNDSFLRQNLDWMKKASNWYANNENSLVSLSCWLTGCITHKIVFIAFCV